LYELIFKRIPDDTIYTENDKLSYKNILLTTNAHRRIKRIIVGKRYKYKNIIAPLVLGKIQVGTGISRARKLNKLGKKVEKVIPRAMTLNENKIDYVHWDSNGTYGSPSIA